MRQRGRGVKRRKPYRLAAHFRPQPTRGPSEGSGENDHATHRRGTGPRRRIRAHVRPRAGAELDRAARKPALSLEMGRGRRARLRQPHEARERAARRPAHQDRRGHRDRARAERQDAVLRHASLRRPHQALVHERLLQPPRQQRGIVISEIGQVGTQFDGFAHQTHEDSHYNCFKTGAISTRGELHQARHREGRHADDPRRADRRGGAQGRGHAARHLRDHGQGPAGRAGEAAGHAAAGRRGPHQYRLEQAVGEGQRALREELPGHRRRARRSGSPSRIPC